MSTLDMTQPVWRVVGHLPPPDGRRMTVFVNAPLSGSEEARVKGLAEGLHTIEKVDYISPERIAEWEKLVPIRGK
jgi:hypothetical protein